LRYPTPSLGDLKAPPASGKDGRQRLLFNAPANSAGGKPDSEPFSNKDGERILKIALIRPSFFPKGKRPGAAKRPLESGLFMEFTLQMIFGSG
jgi:hypothetical protein